MHDRTPSPSLLRNELEVGMCVLTLLHRIEFIVLGVGGDGGGVSLCVGACVRDSVSIAATNRFLLQLTSSVV